MDKLMNIPMKKTEEAMETDSDFMEYTKQGHVPSVPRLARSSSLDCLCPKADSEVHSCAFQLREAQSFTSAFEHLRISQNETPVKPTLSLTVEIGKCPCGCQEAIAPSHAQFRTREVPSMALFIAGPEILNFQGTKYHPADIASAWKKDCRTWLWKNGKPVKSRTRVTLVAKDPSPYSFQ